MLQHLPVEISNCCLASALASPSPALPWPAGSVPRSGRAVAWKQSRLLITSENPPHVATPHSSCYLASLAFVGRMFLGLYATVSTHRMLQHLPVEISNCCLASALASPSPALPWPARSVPRTGCVVALARALECSATGSLSAGEYTYPRCHSENMDDTSE